MRNLALFAAVLLLCGGLGSGSLKNGSLSKGSLQNGSIGPLPGGGGAAVAAILDVNPTGYGQSTIPSTITVNGIEETAVFRYEGANAGASSWTATIGDDLATSSQAGTDPPSLNQGTPSGDLSKAVGFGINSLVYGEASDNLGALTTGDFIIEAIVKTPDTSGERYLLGRYPTAPYWLLYFTNGGDVLRFISHDGTTAEGGIIGSSFTKGAWYHFFIVGDRSGSVRAYVDGRSSGTTGLNLAQGSYENAAIPFTIGDTSTGANSLEGEVAFIQMFHGSSTWLNSHAQDALAQERFGYASGTVAYDENDVASGPTTRTRADEAWLRVCDPTTDTVTAYRVGEDWVRAEVFCGSDWSDPTVATTRAGILIEDDHTNMLLQSGDLATTWVAVNATIDIDQQNDLDGSQTMDDVDGTGVGEHGVSQAVTLTATEHTLSVYARAGNQTWAYLTDDTIPNAYAYFNLSTCETGSRGVQAIPSVENMGGGLCRLAIGLVGTAASHSFRLLCAESDGDKDFTGAAGDCSFGWAQLVAEEVAASYVATTTGTAAALDDDLIYYSADQNISEHTVILDAYFPDTGFSDNQTSGLHWSDDASSSRIWSMTASVYSSQPNPTSQWFDGTLNLTLVGSGNTGDGAQHILRYVADVPNTTGHVCFDSVCQTTTSLTSAATGVNRLVFGALAATGQGWQNYFRVRIYDGAYLP